MTRLSTGVHALGYWPVSVNSAGQSPEGADRGDVVVDALGVGEQRGARGARGVRPLVLRGPQQAEAQLELVARQVARPAELGEAALAEAPLGVELGEPELGEHVPEREEQVVRGCPPISTPRPAR